MTPLRVLGVDLGTTALKAVISDGRARIVGAASAPITTSRPKPGWSEQHPDQWWRALRSAAQALAERHPSDWRRIAAINLSGQMHGAILLSHGRPLRPAILHNDGRATAEAAMLNQMLPHAADLAGVRAMAGFVAPKLLWLQRHEPDVLKQADMLLCPKDMLRFHLTGVAATDPVDASGMWLLDVAKRQWSAEIIAATGLTSHQLPALLEAGAAAGQLTPASAKALTLPAGLPVMCGTGDAAANALGLGLCNSGDGVISLGTAAQIFVTRARHLPRPVQNIHAFAHGLPDRWFQMAALLNGASPLAWISERLAVSNIPAMLRQVERRMGEPSRLLFLPYLAGERTPHDDPAARAAFLGIDATTDAVDLGRAVLEGVALSLADCHEILCAAGPAPRTLYAVGGGTRSLLWARIIASALGQSLTLLPAGDYGGALGAARLARLGLTGETRDAIFTKPKVQRIVQPEAAWQAVYRQRLPQFRELYKKLKPCR